MTNKVIGNAYHVDAGAGLHAELQLESIHEPLQDPSILWICLGLTGFCGWMLYLSLSLALFPESVGFWGAFGKTLPGIACWVVIASFFWGEARKEQGADGFCFKVAILLSVICLVSVFGQSFKWTEDSTRWINVISVAVIFGSYSLITLQEARKLSAPWVKTLPPTGATKTD